MYSIIFLFKLRHKMSPIWSAVASMLPTLTSSRKCGSKDAISNE